MFWTAQADTASGSAFWCPLLRSVDTPHLIPFTSGSDHECSHFSTSGTLPFLLHLMLHLYTVSESEVAQSCLTLCNPWTVAHQAPLSNDFSKQENLSVLPSPPPGDLPNPGIESMSSALAGGFFTAELPGKQEFFTTVP